MWIETDEPFDMIEFLKGLSDIGEALKSEGG